MNKDIKLHETMDAAVWAKEFMSQEFGYLVDEDLIRAWFANAIMCGYDHAYWKLNKKFSSVHQWLHELELAANLVYQTHKQYCPGEDCRIMGIDRLGVVLGQCQQFTDPI